MREQYIILRKPIANITSGGFGMAESFESTESNYDFEELDEDEASEAALDPSIAAIAPSVPVSLVVPVTRSASATGSVDLAGPSWGIEAIGLGQTAAGDDGTGVTVGLLDTGIDEGHAAFAGMQLVQRDYTGEGNGDADGHGTHCAGTFFGRDVDGRRIGVARGVQRAFIGKVLGRQGGTSLAVYRAINDAITAGARVISMSLGFDFPKLTQELEGRGLPTLLAAGVALARYRANVRLFDRVGESIRARVAVAGEDAVLVAAAGNESNRLNGPRHEQPTSSPAEAEGFVSVGALSRHEDGKLRVAPFSNPGCLLAAPGVDIVSAKAGTKSGLIPMSGTIMATPHVAGVAAILLQRQTRVPLGFGHFGPPAMLRERLLWSTSRESLAADQLAAHFGMGALSLVR